VTATAGLPFALIAVIGMLLIGAVVVTIGAQLLRSNGTTKRHLKNAAALTTALNAAATERAAAAARIGSSTASDERSPHAVFGLLNEYYAANISQAGTIFWASLLAMSAGFAIIFVGVVLAGINSTAALVTAIAGVLSQFVGATFLVVLRSTQAQSTAYAANLTEFGMHQLRAADEQRSIALGLQLIDEISSDGASALANQTRAAIALGLIVKDPVPPLGTPTPVTTTVDEPPAPAAPAGASAPQPRARAQSVAYDQTAPSRQEPAPSIEAS